jgi:hypothetical protein
MLWTSGKKSESVREAYFRQLQGTKNGGRGQPLLSAKRFSLGNFEYSKYNLIMGILASLDFDFFFALYYCKPMRRILLWGLSKPTLFYGGLT